MREPIINRTVLMTDPDNFSVVELNPYSHEILQPDVEMARREHDKVRHALGRAGINVIKVPSPQRCQDGIYTANWAFCSGDTAVMANLPDARQAEVPYAKSVLCSQELLGRHAKTNIVVPPFRYSGQGDTLKVGDTLFVGSQYRTDPEMTGFLQDVFQDRYQIEGVRTLPLLDEEGQPKRNELSQWPESLFYDIDLAIGVIKPDLIAWCPEAFTAESQDKINDMTGIDKIEVSLDEAIDGLACNLISTGDTVVMGTRSPKLRMELAKKGLITLAVDTPEINKGGGFIRCISLTLDN